MKKEIKLLSVEDDMDDIYIIQQYLKQDPTSEFIFDFATSIHQASQKLHNQQFDAILLDLHLPDGSGEQSLKQLTKQFPQLPIIVVTDLDSPEMESQLIASGAEDYINKADLSNRLLSRVIRLSIERKQLQIKIEESTLKDDLTGLYSRQNFYQHLNAAIAQAERNPFNIALAFIDLDDFKHINDTYGHLAGDDALRQFGQFLTSSKRQTDIAARLGGDEFAMILSQYDTMESLDAFMQRNFKNHAIEITTQQDGKPITLPLRFSMGIEQWQPGNSADQLIQQADTAMYKVKHKNKRQH